MADLIEYVLEDGTILQVVSPSAAEKHDVPAGETFRGGARSQETGKAERRPRFGEAVEAAKKASSELMAHLRDLQADEVEVEFGLSATGKAGSFAIGMVGVEANYVVRLKWNRKDRSS
jgi:hypothetical protein